MRCQIRPSPVGKALGCGCSGCVPADSSSLQRVLPSSCRKQHRHTQQPACRAPPLHQQGACGFQNPSVLTRRRSATPQDFIFPPPPPSFKKCDSPVSNGDISFPTYSGSSWLCNTWGCGEKGGESQTERSKNRSLSAPRRYVASPFQKYTIWDVLANSTAGKQHSEHIAEKDICTSSDAIRCQSGGTALHIP